MMKIKKILFTLLYLIAPLTWGAGLRPRNPSTLLEDALNPATMSYQGQMKIMHGNNKQSTVELVNVWFRPPSYYRWEFLSPDGKVNRVCVSDGTDEQLHLVKSDTTLNGSARHSHKKRMGAQHEFDLLAKNYEMVLSGVSVMAGQKAYMVDLIPKQKGKPSQRIWIDEDSNIILGSRRSQPEGNISHESHFVDFRGGGEIPSEFFQVAKVVSNPAIEHGYDPDFLSDEQLRNKTGRHHNNAPVLPGFEMESVDSFISDGAPISHYRYTDGLVTLSLFETKKPARFSQHTVSRQNQAPEQLSDVLLANDAGHILQTKHGDTYLILIGDLSTSELQTLFQSSFR